MDRLQMSLSDCVKKVKESFEHQDFQVGETKDINYGIQFKISHSDQNGILRIYHNSKKGAKIDFSQLKPDSFKIQVQRLLELSLTGQTSLDLNASGSNSSSSTPEEELDSLIGTDESGKGDYLEPLVIAGIFIKKTQENRLIDIGIQDSKKINDTKILELSQELKRYPHSIVTIGPEKYNQLYDKIANLNQLLAWGHGRVIENMLEQVDCQNVLSDQFGSEHLIQNALLDKGKHITLTQRPRAEENIVVAAASILARAGFVQYMDRLSNEYSIDFVKGASKQVISLGKKLVMQYDESILKKVAKFHFKTTLQILEN